MLHPSSSPNGCSATRRRALARWSRLEVRIQVLQYFGVWCGAWDGYVPAGSCRPIPVFVGTTFIVFALVFALPGDPIAALYGDRPISP